jgi:sigma-B regulation protein RsbU (phosphoserine phosphatase)
MLATRARSWIQGICRRFSNATGANLVYTPVVPDEADLVESSLRSDPHCRWLAGINDGNHRTGYLHIESPTGEDGDESLSTVCDLADILAQVLNRYSAEERLVASRTAEVSTLVDLGLTIPRQEDLYTALNRLLTAAVQLTGFRAAAFFLLNPTTNELNLRALTALETNQIPFARRNLAQNPPDLEALVRGQKLVRRDGSAEGETWLPPVAAAGMCLAVQSDAGPLGSLWVFDRRDRLPADSETHVLEAIAVQIAGVLERVVLLKESEIQLRLQRELRAASDNESRDILGALRGRGGFEAAAVCTSRFEVGGDLCELIPLDENRTVIAVGDASGDSIPAALIMSAVRGALRTLTSAVERGAVQTDAVVQQINHTLHSITPAHQFMSLLYAVLDVKQRTFTYTNAGHPGPLLVRMESGESFAGQLGGVSLEKTPIRQIVADPASVGESRKQATSATNGQAGSPGGSGRIVQLTSHGMLLGVIADAAYQHSVVQLEPGDMLVLFSDGISEAMNADRKMFRTEGIIEAVESRLPASANDVLQAILQKLEAHSAGGNDPDDQTLLVLRVP